VSSSSAGGLVGVRSAPRGRALVGTVWPGGAAEPRPGAVVVDGAGRIDRILPGPSADVVGQLPGDLPILGGDGAWIGPGLVDAHVHLIAAPPGSALAGGLVGVRDLGSPADEASRWRTDPDRRRRVGGHADLLVEVSVVGPILTAAGGYPTRSWGAGLGVAAVAESPQRAADVVAQLARRGVDAIKVALEPGPADWPTPNRPMLLAIVRAAHAAGLPVVAHALSARMVQRALDTGIDELVHVPTERLSEELIERIADAGIGVVSTLQTFFSDGVGTGAAANAAALVRAGATLRYGTDLGNTGTSPGVDPRELDRLAQAGLGRLGALRAATEGSAAAAGMRGPTGMLRVGELARAVVLDGDPEREPALWRTPLAVVVGSAALLGASGAPAAARTEGAARPAAGAGAPGTVGAAGASAGRRDQGELSRAHG
jgi:imidazolonepropionase-like amidohydrolase